MAKYISDGKTKSVWEYYEHTCSLKHQHKICVLYNYDKAEYVIEKEFHLSPKRKAEIDQEIIKYCEKVCYYCGMEVSRETLVGFVIEVDNPRNVRYPVGLKCLQDKEWISWEDNFITLDGYLELRNYKGKEELKDCSDLTGYPKVFEAEPETFFIRPINLNDNSFITDFDRGMIAKFRKEVDLTWEKDSGDVEILEGKATNDEKMALLKNEIERNKCQHEWYNSSESRQRCKKCYLLKKQGVKVEKET